MAVTTRKAASGQPSTSATGRYVERHSELGTANTALTASTPADSKARRLALVTVRYSGAATQSGVTVTLNSGAGAGFDVVLSTGSANAQTTTYIPAAEIVIADDDAIDVLAPAGGVGVTASIAIYTEVV